MQPSPLPPLLSIERLEVRPTPDAPLVLHGLSLTMAAGERVAIVGRSGAGKTTLFRAINGMLPASGGCVRFEGEDVSRCTRRGLRALRRRIAVISQKHDLVDSLRVHQNVMAGALGRWSTAYALRYLIWPPADARREAADALSRVGLANKIDERTSDLSGGEQQRVAIARAIVQAPTLMLADEPIASLDPRTANEVLALLCDFAARQGIALLCSLHQPDVAERYFERIIEIRDGRAVERRVDRANAFPSSAVAAGR